VAETPTAGGDDLHHAVTDPAAEVTHAGATLHATDPAAEASPADARDHAIAMTALSEGTTEGTAEGADNAPGAAALSDLHGPQPDAQGRVLLALGDPPPPRL